MKGVLALNGCLRADGAIQKLVGAFAEGARGADDVVAEVRLADDEIA